MRAWLLIVLLAGCEKKPARFEGPLPISFGDCATETTAFVSGPLPQAFSTGPAAPKPPETAAAPTAGGAFATLGDGGGDPIGGIAGTDAGETTGGFGFGRSDFGPGGGTGWGTIGIGRYGTIGGGRGGYGIGRRGRIGAVPTVSVGQPNAQGDLDKAIIRRYIKRNVQKIQYCYEKQLLTTPKLAGTITVQFLIAPSGSVANASAAGVDPTVSSCVAEVIKSIEFPKPKGGGAVQVNYPFTFRPAGDDPAPSPPVDPTPPAGTGVANAAPPVATAPPLEPGHTLYRVGRAQPYEAGADNPLRIERDALTECLRGNPAHFGTAVVELHYDAKGGVASATLHGITDESTRDCIVETTRKTVQPKGAPAVQRCALAFGSQPATDLTTLALTKDGAQLAGAPVSLDGTALMAQLDAAVKAVGTSTAVVTVHDPISLRVDPATPMVLVARAWRAILGAGDDFVFAGLQQVALPAPPVPFSTGGRRARVKSPGHSENVVLSLLVSKERIWVGLSRVNEFQEIPGGDLGKLETTLKEHKASAFFADRTDVEVGGDDDVTFGDVTKVIEVAGKVGFTDWTIAEPKDLAARPSL